jgi:hypothetical protein
MSDARCDCCELPIASCGKAAELRQRAAEATERRRLLNQPDAIPARYAGLCGSCDEPFAEGDPITRYPQGRFGTWRSLSCCPEGASS